MDRSLHFDYGSFLNGASLLTQRNKKFNDLAFAQTVYGYDGNGNMTSKMEGLSGNQATTSYGYDGNGMRTSKTDPNGNLTSYSYGCSDGFLTQTTYPQTGSVSHITTVNPDCSSGDPLTKTDQNGQVTTYGYDGIGRKSSISYPDGGLTSYAYPSPSQVVETKSISASVSSALTTTWDGYGRKSQVSQSDPAGDDVATYSYDGDNRLQCTSNPQRTGSAPTNGSTCISYDALDRPTLITQPDNNRIQVAYSGNQATVTDENGHQKRYQYDAFHDLTAIWEPNASGSPSWETTYAYDAAGRVLNITQIGDGSSAARQRTFQYDSLGRLIKESTPEAGTTNFTVYDNNGNLKSKTDARNITTTYTYDELSRMTAKSSTDGSVSSASYSYDNTTTGSKGIGRLFGAFGSGGTGEGYYYDLAIYLTPPTPTDCGLAISPYRPSFGSLTARACPARGPTQRRQILDTGVLTGKPPLQLQQRPWKVFGHHPTLRLVVGGVR